MKSFIQLGLVALLLIFFFANYQVESTVPGVIRKRARGLYFYRMMRPLRSRTYYRALFRYQSLKKKEGARNFRYLVRYAGRLGKMAMMTWKYITKQWTKVVKDLEFNHQFNYTTEIYNVPQYVPSTSPVYKPLANYKPVNVYKPPSLISSTTAPQPVSSLPYQPK